MKLYNKLEIDSTLKVGALPTASASNFSVLFENGGTVSKRTVGDIINKNSTDFIQGISNSFPSIFNYNTSTTPSDSNLVVSFKNQLAGTVFAAPTTLNGTPSFRKLIDSDLSETSIFSQLGNYVTLDTEQDITGTKTFSSLYHKIGTNTSHAEFAFEGNPGDSIMRIISNYGNQSTQMQYEAYPEGVGFMAHFLTNGNITRSPFTLYTRRVGLSQFTLRTGTDAEVFKMSGDTTNTTNWFFQMPNANMKFALGYWVNNAAFDIEDVKMAVRGGIYSSSNVFANGFKKHNSSDEYVLLGQGGHKLISDFALATDIPDVSNFLSKNISNTVTQDFEITNDWGVLKVGEYGSIYGELPGISYVDVGTDDGFAVYYDMEGGQHFEAFVSGIAGTTYSLTNWSLINNNDVVSHMLMPETGSTTRVLTLGAKLGSNTYYANNQGIVELPDYPNVSGFVPYTGANQPINFNTQKITHDGITANTTSISSQWIYTTTPLTASNKVAYLIIEGLTANTHRQLYIEVESVAGNGEYKKIIKGFIVNFTNTNILGSGKDSRYIEVVGLGAGARYGIGEVEKHSDTALKIPLIWISSTAVSQNKITVQAVTGGVLNLTFSIEYDATSSLTTENPYLYYQASEKWVTEQFVAIDKNFVSGNANNVKPYHTGLMYYHNLQNSPWSNSADVVGSISNFGGKSYGLDLASIVLGGTHLYVRSYVRGTVSNWFRLFHSGNFNPAQYVLQSALNTQLANYVPINGVTTINNTKTFTSSPIVPNATLNGHAVNLGQVNSLISGVDQALGSYIKKGVHNVNPEGEPFSIEANNGRLTLDEWGRFRFEEFGDQDCFFEFRPDEGPGLVVGHNHIDYEGTLAMGYLRFYGNGVYNTLSHNLNGYSMTRLPVTGTAVERVLAVGATMGGSTYYANDNGLIDIPSSDGILSYSSANGIIVTDWNSFALSEYAMSLGYGSVTSGNYATSVGSLLSTTGFGSTNQGYSNSITKALGYSLGAYNSVRATLSGAFGIGLVNRNDGAFIVGRYNSELPIVPYDTTSPHTQAVFAIGAGRDDTDRYTALTVYGDGRADYTEGYDDSNWTNNTLVTKKWVQDNAGGGLPGYRNVNSSATFDLSAEYTGSVVENVYNIRTTGTVTFIGGNAVYDEGYKITIMTYSTGAYVVLDSSQGVEFINSTGNQVAYLDKPNRSVTFIYDKAYGSFRVYHVSELLV